MYAYVFKASKWLLAKENRFLNELEDLLGMTTVWSTNLAIIASM